MSEDRLLLVVEKLDFGNEGGSLGRGAVKVNPEVPGLANLVASDLAEEVETVLDKPGRLEKIPAEE